MEFSKKNGAGATEGLGTKEDGSSHIFGNLRSGLYDGYAVVDLNWDLSNITDDLGIEPFAALASSGTENGFFEFVKKLTNSELSDWEPTTVTLDELCIECHDSTFDPFCYLVWRAAGRSQFEARFFNAVLIRPVSFFAIRHKAWRSLPNGQHRDFYVRRALSCKEALWQRDFPGKKLSHLDMDYRVGFVVEKYSEDRTIATKVSGPTSCLYDAILDADHVLRGDATAYVWICEGSSISIPFTIANRSKWIQMAKLDTQTDEYCGVLLGLAKQVGGLDT